MTDQPTDKTPHTDDADEQLLRSLGQHDRDRRTRDALRPLGDDFQARMVDQIQAQLGADSAAPPQTDAPVDNLADNPASNVVPLTRRPKRTWMAALAASAVAAVGLAFVVGPLQSSGPDLPQYALEFQGGAVVRGSNDAAPLQIGDTLTAVVRPTQAFDGTPTLTVYRRTQTTLVPVDADVQWADSGAARVRVVLTDALPPGPQDWWFVVASSDRAPGREWLEATTPPASGSGWQVLQQRFELVP